jgi:DNA-binding transcriptional ArsR family regulator
MDSTNIERISKALANETRLLIFEAIARNKEMTSSTIVTLRRVAAAPVSHHFKVLSHAGLIHAVSRVGFTAPAPKCSSSNRHCSKLAANSQNTLELKTEEWVSG